MSRTPIDIKDCRPGMILEVEYKDQTFRFTASEDGCYFDDLQYYLVHQGEHIKADITPEERERRKARQKANKRRRKNRQAREKVERKKIVDQALSEPCPVPNCSAEVGVWCFMRRGLGPDMHERRYHRAKELVDGLKDVPHDSDH